MNTPAAEYYVPTPGRPSLFTPETQATILECLRKGYKRKAACALAGIVYGTFLNWQTDAKQNECSPYREFFEHVYEAEEHGKAMLAQKWLDATDRDWRATAKYLAIVDPEEYSEQRQVRMIHEGTVQHTHVHTLAIPLGQVAGLLGAPALPEPAIDGQATEIDPE